MNNPIAVCLDRNPFGDVAELIATAARAGFDRLEWFETGETEVWSRAEEAARIVPLMRRHGLVAQYHAPYEGACDLARNAGGFRSPREIAELLSRFMDRAARLSAEMFTVHLGSCPSPADRPEALRTVAEGIRLAVPELEKRRLRVALENHTSAIIASALGDRPEEFDWLMPALPSPRIGRTLDLGHAHINGHLDDFLARPFDRVFNMHLHDNGGQKDDHLPLGRGGIPWDRVLDRLRRQRYAGAFTLEFFTEIAEYRRSITMLRGEDGGRRTRDGGR